VHSTEKSYGSGLLNLHVKHVPMGEPDESHDDEEEDCCDDFWGVVESDGHAGSFFFPLGISASYQRGNNENTSDQL